MIWAINKDGTNTGEQFDDGILLTQPGDEGFTRELVDVRLASLGTGFTADYMGISWPVSEET